MTNEEALGWFKGRKESFALGDKCQQAEDVAITAIEALIAHKPTVDAVKPTEVITALMDLRDAFVAKQPRGEWYKSDRAQGIEQGIEMAIEKVREMAERREDG